MAASRTFTTEVEGGGSAGRLVLPFDPRAAFGKVRAPVVVTVDGHSYRSTVAAMGGANFVPFRRSHREAAGVRAGDTVEVTLRLDEAPRIVEPPADLAVALRAAGIWEKWQALSYTRRREDAEAVGGAKRPETRRARIEKAVAALGG